VTNTKHTRFFAIAQNDKKCCSPFWMGLPVGLGICYVLICHSEEEWNDDEESRKTYLFVLDLSLCSRWQKIWSKNLSLTSCFPLLIGEGYGEVLLLPFHPLVQLWKCIQFRTWVVCISSEIYSVFGRFYMSFVLVST